MLKYFPSKMKMSEKIKTLQECAGSSHERLLFAGQEDEPLYMLKPKAIYVLTWVNKKILYELPKIKDNNETQWIGVRIRIFANLLNKCVEENIIPKEIAIAYHERVTSRVREICGKIRTEDLPF